MSTTQLDWYTDDCDTFYAATDDPRILAVIQRDGEPNAPWGDAYAPAYYIERSAYGHEASTERAGAVWHDDESDRIAQKYAEAMDRAPFPLYASHRRGSLAPESFAARFVHIFYGVNAISELSDSDNRAHVLIFDTPNYRAAMGTPEDYDRAEYLAGDRAEWRAYFDGDVYGIGYATQVERVIDNPDDAPGGPDFNPDDWTVDIECWGFSGEDYAKEEAAAFAAGPPELPEMLVIA